MQTKLEMGDPLRDAPRYHALDALRASALLMGVVLHSALSFLPLDFPYWAIQDPGASPEVGVLVFVIHAFRMPVFFLLAGFFAHLMIERKGWQNFIKNRFIRIVIPLIVGWVIVIGMVTFIWIWGAILTQSGKNTHAWQHLQQAWQLTRYYFTSSEFPGKNFTLAHLWFLYYLILLYGLVLSLRGLVKLVFAQLGISLAPVKRLLEKGIGSPLNILILALPIVPVLFPMQEWSIDTPDRSLIPHWPTLLLYGYMMALGWFLYACPHLLITLGRKPLVKMSIAIVLTLACLFLMEVGKKALPPQTGYYRLGFVACFAVMLWSWIGAWLGIFGHYCREQSRFWRYLSDASYWVYLVHLPLIASLQVALAPLRMFWGVKLLLILCLALPCLILSYQFFVRYTGIGWVLNGKRGKMK